MAIPQCIAPIATRIAGRNAVRRHPFRAVFAGMTRVLATVLTRENIPHTIYWFYNPRANREGL